MKTISRSAGIISRFADGLPIPIAFLPGGGYSGSTPELDAAVQLAAEALAARYDQPIEIRFNSDRKSGGAYLNSMKEVVGIGGLQQNNHIKLDVFCDLK